MMTSALSPKSAPVPASRRSRMFKLGGLASRVAANVMVEGGKRLVKGERPRASDLLLTTANLTQVADKLAQMRGAAMKLGQLLSMDTGTLLPAELSALLARLQAQGMVMPKTQLLEVLERNWGSDWMEQFSYFSFDPVAAASIGQVHEARTRDGEHLAVKVQFPGVRDSIDSDIDNVLSLLRISGLIPKGLDIDPLVAEARAQLKAEADYQQEAEWMACFNRLLAAHPLAHNLTLPSSHDALSGRDILAMNYLPGEGLESYLKSHPDQAARLFSQMLALFFTELLEFRLMQTDPNPANFSVDPQTGTVVLYDFGAVREFSAEFVAGYKSAIDAAIRLDREGLHASLVNLGFFSQQVEPANLAVILDIFCLAAEPLRAEGGYAFGDSDLARRIQAQGMSISREPDAWHTPPADVLFLHRKMAGLYLLAAKYNATLDARSIYQQVCARVSERAGDQQG